MTSLSSKAMRILSVMYELTNGRTSSVSYEDIVVRAFEKYPEDFHLRGYPQYPDSSDIHKPLYAMKKRGLVRAADKRFQLTPLGLDLAKDAGSQGQGHGRERLTKQEEHEIARIAGSAAFELFCSGKLDDILDTDFYEYLSVSVRTRKSDFSGRLASVEQAVMAHKQKVGNDLSGRLIELHQFMTKKFHDEISARR